MKNLFTLLLIVSSFSGFSQNGYTLEFETTILLSHDTTATIPINTTRIKQYTVPTGMVLKINSGIITDYVSQTLSAGIFFQNSELVIGNQVIKAPFALTTSLAQSVSTVIGGGINGVQPIWANEGTLLQLKYINNATGTITSISAIKGCWISGVLFRKIPN
jgi:hypothetical protein